jgi:antitoxin component HigA of HigAB toxin-antitoxin module
MLSYQAEHDRLEFTLSEQVDYWQTHPLYEHVRVGYDADGVIVAITVSDATLHDAWPARVTGSSNPVRRLRQRFGLSQRELGLVVGVSKPRISQIESQSRVSYELMQKVVGRVKSFMGSHWALTVQTKAMVKGF